MLVNVVINKSVPVVGHPGSQHSDRLTVTGELILASEINLHFVSVGIIVRDPLIAVP